MRQRKIVIWLLLVTTVTWQQGLAAPPTAADAVYSRGAVAADHPVASQVGVEILQQGGNVVDAAAAVGFALSVLHPASSGIGGGGFLMIWLADEQRCIVLDYRERAPLRATAEMFVAVESAKQLSPRSVRGPLAAAIPQHVAGLCHAVEKYGRLPISKVVAPAIRLAREGVTADPHFIATRKRALNAWLKLPAESRPQFQAFHDLYLSHGNAIQTGDRVRSPQWPALERIASEGAAGFYSGRVAEALLDWSRQHGGLFTAEDFSDVKPVEREPLRLRYHEHDVLTMPPPSSGGIALLTTLQVLDELDDRQGPCPSFTPQGEWLSVEAAHRLTEALQHAFADCAEFLGDADFVDVPVERLISREHARELAVRIDPQRTQPADRYGRFAGLDDAGTTHFSVIDNDGNAVACTETINTEYGSWMVEPQFGILLNNEMDDFAAVPGQPNAFGLLQSSANAIAPRKKPLSSMTPTIVVKDGRAVAAFGASGGPRIISATIQVLLHLVRRQQTPINAVNLPRLHHQWQPRKLELESMLFRPLRVPLTELGHDVREASTRAFTQAATRSAEGLRAASDPRKGGRAAGW